MIKDDISSPRRYITFVQDITRVLPTLVRRFPLAPGDYRASSLCRNLLSHLRAVSELCQGIESLPEPQKFSPWLWTISANQCHRWLRHQRRQVTIDEEMAVVDSAPSASRVSACTRASAEGSGRCFPTEPAATTGRGPFYFEGLSLKRIAAFLDVAVSTVEQRLYRARLNLIKEEMTTVSYRRLKEATSTRHARPTASTVCLVGPHRALCSTGVEI